MGSLLLDHEIRNFANDLISEQFRFYISTEQIPLPPCVDKNTIFNRFGFASETTPPIAQYLKFLSAALKEYVVPAFSRAFPSEVKTESHFFKYCLCFSGLVHHYLLHRCEQAVQSQPAWPALYFLVVCAFIAEFALFCFQRMCFRFACTAKNCVLSVYYRHFQEQFCTKEDLRLASMACTQGIAATAGYPPAMSATEVFVNVSLKGDWDTFFSMVVRPVTEFLNMRIETTLTQNLLCNETGYVFSGYMLRNERDSRRAQCVLCGYGCIIHLRMLLLFEFKPN